MKIAILDDMSEDREQLAALVSSYFTSTCQQPPVLETFESAELFFQTYIPGAYQIILLDVYMDGMNGMEAAIKIREQNDGCQIIFITSSTDYAVGSYDVHAAYYILKPIDPEKLNQSLSICMARLSENQENIEVLCSRIPVTIPLNSIMYANTYHNAVHIYTTAGLFKTYMTFEAFLQLLAEDERFLLCYKGCIVNMDHVLTIQDNDFVFPDQTRVQIRKRGSNLIKKQYTQYLFSKTDR